MIALTILLAVLVGISLGLLGGGGAMMMVPLLTYVAGMECKHAIATSLLVVLAAPVLTAGLILLFADRHLGTVFFDASKGGGGARSTPTGCSSPRGGSTSTPTTTAR